MEPQEVTTPTETTVETTETPVERTPLEPTGSLSDHREEFGSKKPGTRMQQAAEQAIQAEQAPPEKVKTRNRARSQDASPDELKQISALGKEAREAEEAVSEALGLKPTEGESPRLFELRRRKEIAAALKAIKAQPAAAVPVREDRPAPKTSTATTLAEPDASDTTKYPYGVADPKYLKDLTAFSVAEALRADEVQRETAALERDQAEGKKRFAERWQQAKAEIKDFEAIASRPVPWEKGTPIDLYVWTRPYGAKLLWYLNHPDHLAETREIMALPMDDQIDRLSLLGQRLHQSPAGVNGKDRSVEPATVVTPSPRLPTPVKTGPMTRSSEPPDPSTMSLRDHRASYQQAGRRRR